MKRRWITGLFVWICIKLGKSQGEWEKQDGWVASTYAGFTAHSSAALAPKRVWCCSGTVSVENLGQRRLKRSNRASGTEQNRGVTAPGPDLCRVGHHSMIAL